MTPAEEILLKEMRYIAGISTGQVKRAADAALSTVSAMCAQQVAVPDEKREPLSGYEITKWWASENGLEDCDMCIHGDFEAVIRAVEAFHGITGAKPEAGIPVSETKVRPQNCGTNHCSCIECPYPKADWSAA